MHITKLFNYNSHFACLTVSFSIYFSVSPFFLLSSVFLVVPYGIDHWCCSMISCLNYLYSIRIEFTLSSVNFLSSGEFPKDIPEKYAFSHLNLSLFFHGKCTRDAECSRMVMWSEYFIHVFHSQSILYKMQPVWARARHRIQIMWMMHKKQSIFVVNWWEKQNKDSTDIPLNRIIALHRCEVFTFARFNRKRAPFVFSTVSPGTT